MRLVAICLCLCFAAAVVDSQTLTSPEQGTRDDEVALGKEAYTIQQQLQQYKDVLLGATETIIRNNKVLDDVEGSVKEQRKAARTGSAGSTSVQEISDLLDAVRSVQGINNKWNRKMDNTLDTERGLQQDIRALATVILDYHPCASNPCQFGGTCHDVDSGMQCECDPYHTGWNCMNERICDSGLCQNGGTCYGDDVDYRCACMEYFSGTSCEIDSRPAAEHEAV